MGSHKEHVIDILFPLALLLAFLASAVMVLLLAADIYQDTTDRSVRAHTGRTVTAYVTEKIHQNDEEGRIYKDMLDGCDVLVLERENYRTYLYSYGGFLRELMAGKDLEITPEMGRKILKIEDFTIEQVKDNLFYFSCTDDANHRASAYVGIRSREE